MILPAPRWTSAEDRVKEALVPLGRRIAGTGATLGTVALLSIVMLAVRPDVTPATAGLVLVIPVLVGVVTAGLAAGFVAVVAGFLAYDLLFVPPYYSLTVNRPLDWVALAIYTTVMIVLAKVVSSMQHARRAAQRRESDARRLFRLSDMLIEERRLADLCQLVADSVLDAFGSATTAAVVMPGDGGLEVVASAGPPLQEADLAAVLPAAGALAALRVDDPASGTVLRSFALRAARGGPVGLLVVKGALESEADQELLGAFANHVAMAIERTQLREQAMRAELLEEVDRWRNALVGSVSHDLRTPLSSVKAAVSDLRDPSVDLPAAQQDELLEMIEAQTDHLSRLVTNLLDMSRIDAGVLKPRRQPISIDDLVAEALSSLGSAVRNEAVRRPRPGSLPLVDVDHVLVAQVLANLLDNASRHAPPGTSIEVDAQVRGDQLEVAVTDEGPGVSAVDRQRILQMFDSRDGGGRAGLGLAIAKAFVEAHGGRLRVEDGRPRGARFVFDLPLAYGNPEMT